MQVPVTLMVIGLLMMRLLLFAGAAADVDAEDDVTEPVIKLSDNKYTIREPMFKEETSILQVPVIREGDLSETAVVTINTKDGSADAGKDYNGFFKGEGSGRYLVKGKVMWWRTKRSHETHGRFKWPAALRLGRYGGLPCQQFH